MTVMVMPGAVHVMVVMMTMEANTHADITDMNADADTGERRRCAEQRQRNNGNDQFLHYDSL